MSSSSTAPTGHRSDVWARVQEYAPVATQPVAAGAAIVPVYYLFMKKTAEQLGQPFTRMPWSARFLAGVHASPEIAGVVGAQLMSLALLEKAMTKGSSSEPAGFGTQLMSSVIVGTLSTPALAVFNARTAKLPEGITKKPSVMEVMRKLTPKQTAACVARESSFLLSVRVSDPAGKAMSRYAGDNKFVEYAATGFSGWVGSMIGHPFDTVFTRLQAEKTTGVREVMKGSLTKARGVAGFALGLKLMNEALEKASSRQ